MEGSPRPACQDKHGELHSSDTINIFLPKEQKQESVKSHSFPNERAVLPGPGTCMSDFINNTSRTLKTLHQYKTKTKKITYNPFSKETHTLTHSLPILHVILSSCPQISDTTACDGHRCCCRRKAFPWHQPVHVKRITGLPDGSGFGAAFSSSSVTCGPLSGLPPLPRPDHRGQAGQT